MNRSASPPRRRRARGPATEQAQILDALRRIVRAIRLSAQATERHLGVSAAQLFVLERLAAEPGVSLQTLAESALTDRSAISLVTARLVALGLVQRSTSRDDRRRAVLRPTAKGRALLRRAPSAPTSRLLVAIGSLPVAERRGLARTLHALTAALGLEHERPRMLFEDDSKAGRRRVVRSR